jgi:mevalonate kinase
MQDYYGNGKLLLSGEYYVLDGALALALPTSKGQRLSVTYFPSDHKVLHWKSYDDKGNLWFEAKFDVENFECLDRFVSQKSMLLQKILQKARKLASNFLKGREYVLVETFLEFPIVWGLGSSSTLIHNIATWAGISPFELLFTTVGGSGYDVACAQANSPILYQKTGNMPTTQVVEFDPPFKANLYFIYLGKKQSSQEGIEYYRSLIHQQKETLVLQLTEITQKMVKTQNLDEFDVLLRQHEELISESLKMERVKNLYFSDYWGEVKSLGAWGGDFILATSKKSCEETKTYFKEKGFEVVIPYNEMIKSEA